MIVSNYMKNMRIINIKKKPKYKDIAIKYFQDKWASEESLMVY